MIYAILNSRPRFGTLIIMLLLIFAWLLLYIYIHMYVCIYIKYRVPRFCWLNLFLGRLIVVVVNSSSLFIFQTKYIILFLLGLCFVNSHFFSG